MRGLEESLEWGLRRVVAFDDFGFDAQLGDELNRREEEVHEETPLMSVELVESGGDARIVEAIIAQVLADDGPVFSFDMGVIVFLILTGSCILHRSFSIVEVFEQGPI